jgi:hypothetical protein
MSRNSSTTAKPKSANASIANGGETSKPKPKRKRASRAKAKTRKPASPRAKNLPEPVDVQTGAEVQPEKPAGLGSLFQSSPNPTLPSPSVSDGGSATSSNSSPDGELSPEAERLLSSVPESIGDVQDGPGAGSADVQANDNPVAALMAAVAFEEQDVQDTLGEIFEWMADRFKSDHWELSERQARMLGRPTAQLLNSLWAKLQNKLPDILSRWMDDTPGAAAFFLACGIVLAPKITKQYAISKDRKRTAPMVRASTAHGSSQPAPKPAAPAPPQQPAPQGMIWAKEDAA